MRQRLTWKARTAIGGFRASRAGSSAIEFGYIIPYFLILLLGEIGFGEWLFTQQAMQTAGMQTARCVAISGAACASPTSYTVSNATALGVNGLTTSGVSIVNTPTSTTNATACSPPGSNVFVRVTLTVPFVAPLAYFMSSLSGNIVTVSCYPITGS